jgi:transcriptional regulator with XRE-family HTH domain
MSQGPINWRELVDEAVRRRKAEQMTQSELAELAGVSRPTVVTFEQGEINLRFERIVAILDALGLFIQPGRADSLAMFIHEAKRRFTDLTQPLAAEHPSLQPHGHSEQAYAIDGVGEVASIAKLREILAAAPRTSGWRPFWLPTTDARKPSVQNGALECWTGKPDKNRIFEDAAHSDFWRVARDGKAYLQRGYQEDGPDLDAGTFFDLTLPIWRTAEFLIHAGWMAGQLGAQGNTQIRIVARYTGLAGRELISWTKPTLRFPIEKPLRARSDIAEIDRTITYAEIEEHLEEAVALIVRPLYERFDGFIPSDDLVTSQVRDLTSRMPV